MQIASKVWACVPCTAHACTSLLEVPPSPPLSSSSWTSLAPGGCASLPPAGLAPWRPAQRGPANLALCNGTCCQQLRCTSADLIAARLIALCLKLSPSTAQRQRDPTAEHGQRGGPCPAATALGRDLSGARARGCEGLHARGTATCIRNGAALAPSHNHRTMLPSCVHKHGLQQALTATFPATSLPPASVPFSPPHHMHACLRCCSPSALPISTSGATSVARCSTPACLLTRTTLICASSSMTQWATPLQSSIKPRERSLCLMSSCPSQGRMTCR